MAVFKIITSRPIEKKDFDHKPQLDVQLLSGKLNVGDDFVLYETHHPFDVIIRKIEDKGDYLTLHINCAVSYEGCMSEQLLILIILKLDKNMAIEPGMQRCFITLTFLKNIMESLLLLKR